MNKFPVFSNRDEQLAVALVSERFITMAQLDALKAAGGGIINGLIRGGITPTHIARALSKYYDRAFVSLEGVVIPVDVLAVVHHGTAWSYWTVPIGRVGNEVTLAMADPGDTLSIKELSRLLGLDIAVVVSPAEQIGAILEVKYAFGKERGLRDRKRLEEERLQVAVT